MRHFFILIIFPLLMADSARAQDPAPAKESAATRARIEALVVEIDRIDNRIRQTENDLRTSIRALGERVEGFGELSREREDLRSELRGIIDLKLRLERAEKRYEEILTGVASAQARIEANEGNVRRAKENSENVIWIISIISAVASGLILLVGLFFSKRFMDVYADGKVSRAILERIEEQTKGNSEIDVPE